MQQSRFVSDGKTATSTNPDSGTTVSTVLTFTLTTAVRRPRNGRRTAGLLHPARAPPANEEHGAP